MATEGDRQADAPDRGATPAGAGNDRGAGTPARPPPAARGDGEAHERIDGLRSWLAQVDRKLGIRTYVGAAAAVLGLATAIVALVLVLQTRDDAAKKGDLEQLQEEISGVEQQASEAAQEDIESLTDRLDRLEDRVSNVAGNARTGKRELSVVQDDIQELRDQIADLDRGGGGGGGGGGGSSGN